MNTNDIIMEIHGAVLSKIRENCKVSGNKQYAMQISADIIEYAKTIANAFGDDGMINEVEAETINGSFAVIVKKYIPSIENKSVKIAWNGVNLLICKIDGLKSYLAKWFGLVF